MVSHLLSLKQFISTQNTEKDSWLPRSQLKATPKAKVASLVVEALCMFEKRLSVGQIGLCPCK